MPASLSGHTVSWLIAEVRKQVPELRDRAFALYDWLQGDRFHENSPLDSALEGVPLLYLAADKGDVPRRAEARNALHTKW